MSSSAGHMLELLSYHSSVDLCVQGVAGRCTACSSICYATQDPGRIDVMDEDETV